MFKKLVKFPYSRMVYGIICIILGIAFSFVPILPFGYIFLFMGFFLLSYKIPVFRKWMNMLKKKDKKGRLERYERKLNDFFGEDSNSSSSGT